MEAAVLPSTCLMFVHVFPIKLVFHCLRVVKHVPVYVSWVGKQYPMSVHYDAPKVCFPITGKGLLTFGCVCVHIYPGTDTHVCMWLSVRWVVLDGSGMYTQQKAVWLHLHGVNSRNRCWGESV